MTTIIPESLITELAERRCILFVGSGCSMQCTGKDGASPPSWPELLKSALEIAHQDDRESAKKQIESGNLLDAAEIISSRQDAASFSKFISDTFESPEFKPGKLHDNIIRIDPKIYISTNYDDLLEQAARVAGISEFRTKAYNDDGVVDTLRSPKRLLYKIHGCLTEPQKIVLSRSDYFTAKQKYGFAYRVLDALFLTNTVLFLGCGLHDPDIQLVLENAQVSAISSHTHYALMPSGMPPALMNAVKRSYNIQILPYDNDDGSHSELPAIIQTIADRVEAARSR